MLKLTESYAVKHSVSCPTVVCKRTCTVCGKRIESEKHILFRCLKQDDLDYLDHPYGFYVCETPHMCDKAGEAVYFCSRCRELIIQAYKGHGKKVILGHYIDNRICQRITILRPILLPEYISRELATITTGDWR